MTNDEEVTPVSSFESPSRPSWELSAEHYAGIVVSALDEKIKPVQSGLATLTDAFTEHTAEEKRQRNLIMGALAAKTAMPMVALAISIAALVIGAMGWSVPAQASPPACITTGGAGP